MLAYNPRSRPTASQALKYSFFDLQTVQLPRENTQTSRKKSTFSARSNNNILPEPTHALSPVRQANGSNFTFGQKQIKKMDRKNSSDFIQDSSFDNSSYKSTREKMDTGSVNSDDIGQDLLFIDFSSLSKTIVLNSTTWHLSSFRISSNCSILLVCLTCGLVLRSIGFELRTGS